MKRKLTMFLTLFLMGIGLATAQTQVRGTVVDEAGEVAIGATIQIKGTTQGTVTDANGAFTLSAPAGGTLIISYVGYVTQEVGVSASPRIVLVVDAEVLEDVIVVAYGAVKKQSMVGAQSYVTAKQLEKRPITNLTSALGGAAPGVQVLTSSGQPGTSSDIRIRGFGSVNASSAPLYVVDGAVYNGNIADIAAQDIQSVNILKDAAATSLYGSSAGNGVVLVTTKSGSGMIKGKPQFTFTSNVGISRRGMVDYEKVDAMQFYPLRWQQWFNDYKYNQDMADEQAAFAANKDAFENLRYQPYKGINTYVTFDGVTKQWKKTDNPTGNDTYPLIVMPDGTLNPEINGLLWADDMNWGDALFRTGLRQEYVLSGGFNTEKMKSYLSLSYLGEEGYKKFTSLNRFSSRLNLSYDITKWLSVGTNTSIVRGHSEAPKTLGSYSANAFGFMTGIGPIYPIHQHNEDGSYVLDGLGNKLYDYNDLRPYTPKFNPVYEQTIDKSYTDRDAITSRTFAQINLYKGLSLRTNLAYDLLRNTSKVRYNNIMGDQPQGMLTITNRRYSTITFNQLLEYDTNIGDHHINALLGHEAYQYKYESSSAKKDKMFILGLDEMSNMVNMTDISSGTSNYRKEGYLGRINYDFSDLYNLSVSYRYDGSSRFAPKNRWGHFWSMGAGWNISNEEFMNNFRGWLSNLKLRGSVGQTGNDDILNSSGSSRYYLHQTLFGLGNNNLDNIGLRVSNLGNPDLVWEKQTSYDLALEFGLFKRFTGTVELFNKESDDLLFAFPLPASTGVSSIDKNLGKIRNYGLELDLRYNIIRNKNWEWTVAMNGTVFRNKIVRLPEENRKDGIESGTKKWMEGKSIYDFYLNEYIGVDPEDGKAIYRLDDITYPELADPKNPNFMGMEKEGEKATWTKDGRYIKKHYAGTVIPDLYGGFSSEVSYKNLDFAIQFAYQLGGRIYDSGYQGFMGRRLSSGSGRAMHVDMLNAWKKQGDITNVPRLDAISTNYDNETSDRYLISGTSLMLKSISLGYTLPAKWIKPIDLTKARISIVGENLFLLSKRKGLNPMANYSGVSSAIAYDYAKIISANISISF